MKAPSKFFLANAIVLSLSLFSLYSISDQVVRNPNVEVKDLIPPPPYIEHYSFGLKPQFADVFWVRSLQDFDYCEKKIRRHLCKGNSWLFHMLNAVVSLDSQFYIAYTSGGLALTIIISDFEGATKIFDKGVLAFPNDWNLLFRAAYHVLYEEKDFLKASNLFQRAGLNGAPEWTLSLSKRLSTRNGQIEVAERLLADLIRREEDESLISQLRRKIEDLKIQQ